MKKILSVLLVCIITVSNMGVLAFAEDTLNPEDIAADVAGQEAATDVGGSETTAPPETVYVTVTDENGEAVTDANGEVVTEVSIVESVEGEGEETTAPNREMEGQFETRELSNEDMIALERIKDELAEKKDNQFADLFSTVLAVAGILIVIYTFVVFIAFLIDKLNFLADVDCLRVVTINNAVTLRDEADRDILQAEAEKLKLMTTKGIIINTVCGCLLGVLLTQSTKLMGIVESIYYFIIG